MKTIIPMIDITVSAYKHIYIYLPHTNIQKSNRESHLFGAKGNDTSFTAKEALFPEV